MQHLPTECPQFVKIYSESTSSYVSLQKGHFFFSPIAGTTADGVF
jgi:hypothetical protein